MNNTPYYETYQEPEEDLEMLYGTHEPLEPLIREHENPDFKDLGRQVLE